MYNFRTDMAVERQNLYQKANKVEQIPGIKSEKEIIDDIEVSRVKIENSEGEKAIGKPIGNYITIDIKNLKIATEEEIYKSAKILTEELKKLINNFIDKKEDIMVVGLGNVYVTPDSLGPSVVKDIDITRHLIEHLPQYVDKDTRPVTAISPGVLGTTGIETQEILMGIIEKIKPKLVIIIDALASRSIQRISSTIQLADTGITPGAGVGNKRKELTRETLGIPVIAIGIPTVVEAATIAADSLDLFIEKMEKEVDEPFNTQNNMHKLLKELTEEDKYNMIKEVLTPNDYNFIVTPKEIDELIKNMSSIVARGINDSLQ